MSDTALMERSSKIEAIELAMVQGDLSKLTAPERVNYYNRVCQSLDLNPLTKPFAYIVLNGKLTLYALKDCTEQLRSNRSISLKIVARELVEDVYVVTAQASTPAGRCDESIGAVPIAALKGEARANAFMKAETKAKRRVTLSICGLGMLDETEIEAIPNAVRQPSSAVASPLPQLIAEKPAGYDDWWDDMQACADNGEGALRQAWERSAKDYRHYLSATNRAGWDALKDRAVHVGEKDFDEAGS